MFLTTIICSVHDDPLKELLVSFSTRTRYKHNCMMDDIQHISTSVLFCEYHMSFILRSFPACRKLEVVGAGKMANKSSKLILHVNLINLLEPCKLYCRNIKAIRKNKALSTKP